MQSQRREFMKGFGAVGAFGAAALSHGRPAETVNVTINGDNGDENRRVARRPAGLPRRPVSWT